MAGRLIQRAILGLCAIGLFTDVTKAQSSVVQKQIEYLTNPKGWVVHSVAVISGQQPVGEKLREWSRCTSSSTYTFGKDGSFSQIFALKKCPDQLIEDVRGTWTYTANPAIRNGIITLTLQNSAIEHDISFFHIMTIEENTMMAVGSPSYYNPEEEIWIFNVKGYKLPVDNPFQGMPPVEQDVDVTKYFTEAEIKAANTAATADYLTKDEKLIFLHTNLVRMYPGKYKILMERTIDAQEDYIRTSTQGDQVYYGSLMKDLVQRKPTSPLQPDRQLYDAALCWAKESGEKGIQGHDREDCAGKYSFSGENCSYGSTTSHDAVFGLLIDYGVDGFGHRLNLLDPGYTKMGCAIQPHRSFLGICAVQDFD